MLLTPPQMECAQRASDSVVGTQLHFRLWLEAAQISVSPTKYEGCPPQDCSE